MPETLIQLQNVKFTYSGETPVFSDLRFELRQGERVGVVGDIGSGKTTLLHLIVGLLKPEAGTIFLFGNKCVSEKQFHLQRKKIGMVFQDPDDQLFCPTVLEDVAFGPLNMGMSTEEAEARAMETLKRIGLENYEQRLSDRLSGGEKRLVALATVLAMQPKVLMLDEPQNGLDSRSLQRLEKILLELDCALILVSHSLELIKNQTQRVFDLTNRL